MLPDINHPKWRDLVLGKTQGQIQSLGAKILMGRVLNSVKFDGSEANVAKCIQEVRDFFAKNEKLMQKDITTIFG